MTAMFKRLMTGLDEVDAFISGKRAGYKVTVAGDTNAEDIGKKSADCLAPRAKDKQH
jgi:hypothetical protein